MGGSPAWAMAEYRLGHRCKDMARALAVLWLRCYRRILLSGFGEILLVQKTFDFIVVFAFEFVIFAERRFIDCLVIHNLNDNRSNEFVKRQIFVF